MLIASKVLMFETCASSAESEHLRNFRAAFVCGPTPTVLFFPLGEERPGLPRSCKLAFVSPGVNPWPITPTDLAKKHRIPLFRPSQELSRNIRDLDSAKSGQAAV